MPALRGLFLLSSVLFFAGCVRLFGWDIHSPGILSESFAKQISPIHERVALYLPPDILKFESTDRGSQFADPQTFHVGEAFGPMLLEGFQDGFQEFIFMEKEPTPEILKRYSISYLVLIRIKEFKNHVTMKGQALSLMTETLLLDSDMKVLARYESRGTSDAQSVFRKKGGPQVNLNAAIERNVLAILQYLQDMIQTQGWKGKGNP